MPNTTTYARVPYSKRPAPESYEAGWVNTELGNLQRSFPPWRTRTATADDVPQTTDHTILYDTTQAPITVTLRPPGQVHDLVLVLKKISSDANAVSILGTVDGVSNPTLAIQYQSLTIQSNGIAWYKLAST